MRVSLLSCLAAPLALVLFVSGCSSAPKSHLPTADHQQEEIGGDILVAWNERVFALAEEEDGFLTLKGLRTATMMHLAIHDALSAISGHYQPFLPLPTDQEASPLAATAQAAFEVVASQYPAELPSLEQQLSTWLGKVELEDGARKGVALGKAAAAAILESRSGDGWDSEAEYQWHPMGPGVYAEFEEHSGTPKGFVFGAGWATAKPFMLDSPSHFRSPPPPPIESVAYTEAFREVKEVGRWGSPTRTSDQTHLALWWKDFAENSHNRLARQIVSTDRLPLEQAARLFALLNMSLYDAYVNVFENKFLYNHWRPYTAIRWADRDGNAATMVDPQWNNTHQHTYAFPSYPSAHGTACSAAMRVFSTLLGDDSPFSMTTETVDKAGPFSGKRVMDPAIRSFSNFSAAAEECALSRIYLGIHFRYDSLEGIRLGGKIGDFAVAHFLGPKKLEPRELEPRETTEPPP